jgi:hypothetical protein
VAYFAMKESRNAQTTSHGRPRLSTPVHAGLWLASLFLVGLGARLWFIRRCSSPLPIWDGWTEATLVSRPYLEGKLSLASLIAPHNEHRMLWAWLYDLALLLVNRQWDAQVQMVANTLIYTAGIAGAAWILVRRTSHRFWPVITIVFMLTLGLPFTWENTLSGDQGMVYLSVLIALLTLWLLGSYEPGCYQWKWGVVTALVSLFLPTSGVIASAAICGVLAMKLFRQPERWKRYCPTLGVCLAMIVVGFALRGKPTQAGILTAHSLGGFLFALGQYLAWPWIVLPLFAPINLLPMLILAWVYLRDRKQAVHGEEMVLTLGLWAALQSAASAYARGGLPYPQWRYMDVTCFLMVANCLSICLLVSYHLKNKPCRTYFYAGFLVWGGVCATGLGLLSWRAWTVDVPERQFYQRAQLQCTRAFMATDDAQVFEHIPPTHLPFCHGDLHAPPQPDQGQPLAQLLRNPKFRAVLPACIRPPLKVRVQSEATHGFVANALPQAKREPTKEPSWASWPEGDSAPERTFESLAIKKSLLPYLEIPVTGDLGRKELSLELVDLGTGQRIAVKPSTVPGSTWVKCLVKAPAGDFKIIARDQSKNGGFAFQSPREMGCLSF